MRPKGTHERKRSHKLFDLLYKILALAAGIWTMGSNALCITVDGSSFQMDGNWAENSPLDNLHNSGSFVFGGSGDRLKQLVHSEPNGWAVASCDLRPFNFRLFAEASGGSRDEGGSIFVEAVDRTSFHTDGHNLTFTLNTYVSFDYSRDEQELAFVLRDVTASTTLLYLSNLDDSGSSSRDFSFAVDPTHEYQFETGAWVNAFNGKIANLSAEIQVLGGVPDSSRTIVLLAGALSSLFWVKKRLLVS